MNRANKEVPRETYFNLVSKPIDNGPLMPYNECTKRNERFTWYYKEGAV